MPRVSEEHLERRRTQIMDAARACFIRKGIHETSMQDIFAESGLSAGAVYRYFKSKNEIIEAVATTVIADLHEFIAALATQEPLLPLDEMVERVGHKIVSLSGEDGPVRLAPQAWALSLYDPDIGRYVRENIMGIRGTWAAYAGRLADAGLLPPGSDREALGKVLFSLMPGFLIQRLLLDDIAPEDLRRGIHSLIRSSTPDFTP
ncbi:MULTISPECIES: TetR/AcrR family transcriptional regulator [Actinomadura]|uniref:TetR/AcrR family transcriptional regulator n=1 Tax=Actinomadura yumaensis TaxID=111807 RepID=A0ABW2CIY7_9ACTN|nr:TetR/AcrR family transcriptional regulator [Actinomadura sp. J1-007]MWK33131.1 TetR family transcriptional regulator [Actinomadura sp. J1-007]